MKIVCHVFLFFRSYRILFRSLPNGSFLFRFASFYLRSNSLVCELRVWHLFSYIQMQYMPNIQHWNQFMRNANLKWVICYFHPVAQFLNYHRFFEIPKQVSELLMWGTCPERSIDRVFVSFLCVLSVSSVLGRFIQMYYPDNGT